MGIGPGDEVITTPFTFIASATCIMMAGARPVFVDIDADNLNIDPAKIEASITEKTKAILPVEVFGSPAGFDKVCEIAEKHNLPVLEDSCEALGSALNGKKVGTFGKMSVFAFYPNKQMTTGEVMTDDDCLADMCVSLRNQGRGKGGGWLGHERLGYNYRLSDINCALGIVQLSRIDQIKAKRRKVAQMYQEMLVCICYPPCGRGYVGAAECRLGSDAREGNPGKQLLPAGAFAAVYGRAVGLQRGRFPRHRGRIKEHHRPALLQQYDQRRYRNRLPNT